MVSAPTVVTRPQNQQSSVYYRCLEGHFEAFVQLWWLWKKRKIRLVIPARANMEVSQDLRGYRGEKADGQRVLGEETKAVRVLGVRGLLSYDQFGEEGHQRRKGRKDFRANPIHGIMVVRWARKEYGVGEEKIFLTSLSVRWPLRVLAQYDLRSEIENQGFRELKQGYHRCNIRRRAVRPSGRMRS